MTSPEKLAALADVPSGSEYWLRQMDAGQLYPYSMIRSFYRIPMFQAGLLEFAREVDPRSAGPIDTTPDSRAIVRGYGGLVSEYIIVDVEGVPTVFERNEVAVHDRGPVSGHLLRATLSQMQMHEELPEGWQRLLTPGT